jgi:hypothetical protein
VTSLPRIAESSVVAGCGGKSPTALGVNREPSRYSIRSQAYPEKSEDNTNAALARGGKRGIVLCSL